MANDDYGVCEIVAHNHFSHRPIFEFRSATHDTFWMIDGVSRKFAKLVDAKYHRAMI